MHYIPVTIALQIKQGRHIFGHQLGGDDARVSDYPKNNQLSTFLQRGVVFDLLGADWVTMLASEPCTMVASSMMPELLQRIGHDRDLQRTHARNNKKK